MNKIEHLLLCLAEEAGEVVQAAGKAGRFGLNDQPSPDKLSNNEYIVREVNDVLAILELLKEEGVDLQGIGRHLDIQLKKEKNEKNDDLFTNLWHTSTK